jgi:hypothetical protein
MDELVILVIQKWNEFLVLPAWSIPVSLFLLGAVIKGGPANNLVHKKLCSLFPANNWLFKTWIMMSEPEPFKVICRYEALIRLPDQSTFTMGQEHYFEIRMMSRMNVQEVRDSYCDYLLRRFRSSEIIVSRQSWYTPGMPESLFGQFAYKRESLKLCERKVVFHHLPKSANQKAVA